VTLLIFTGLVVYSFNGQKIKTKEQADSLNINGTHFWTLRADNFRNGGYRDLCAILSFS